MMIKTLIFSRDRALQLDAVLRSFFLHCQDSEKTQVYVLYYATTSVHAQQYKTLKAEYPQVNFVQQRDFRSDVLRLLNPYSIGSSAQRFFTVLNQILSFVIMLERLRVRLLRSILLRLRVNILGRLIPSPEEGYTLLLVDDNLFVKGFSLGDSMVALQTNPEALGFSLRLGRNTVYCYSMDQPQTLPEFNVIEQSILKFDWTTSELDFAYPLEVSSSIYRSKEIFPLIARQTFNNPNELEYQLAVSAELFKQKNPYLLCPESSYTFCNPLNIVQNFAPNRASDKIAYSSEHLADIFDQGLRINVYAYEGFVPQSCHQEVFLKFFQPGEAQN